MKRLFIAIAMVCLLSACSIPVKNDQVSMPKEVTTKNVIATSTVKPTTTMNNEPRETIKPTPQIEPTQTPTEKPTAEFTPKPTATSTPQATVEPTTTVTPEPTEEPTPKPTLKPTEKPTPEPTVNSVPGVDFMEEITPASSAVINSAMKAINDERTNAGVPPATLSSSYSSSCKSHAIAMAESGSCFHASNPGGCEAVGMHHKAMPGYTMGSSSVAHVQQLKSAEVTEVGIGIVYYGDYVFVVVRGR